ncbi:MAG: substrate-binding domain-containing protein, partial [Pseudomonadota bacterium]
APYGVAGRAWLDALPRSDRPNKQVVAENVAQAFHFAKTGNAKAALVALSQLLAESVPPDEYQTLSDTELPPIVQSSVRIARNGYCQDATPVYEFLLSMKAQARLSQLGYRSVEREQ